MWLHDRSLVRIATVLTPAPENSHTSPLTYDRHYSAAVLSDRANASGWAFVTYINGRSEISSSKYCATLASRRGLVSVSDPFARVNIPIGVAVLPSCWCARAHPQRIGDVQLRQRKCECLVGHKPQSIGAFV